MCILCVYIYTHTRIQGRIWQVWQMFRAELATASVRREATNYFKAAIMSIRIIITYYLLLLLHYYLLLLLSFVICHYYYYYSPPSTEQVQRDGP